MSKNKKPTTFDLFNDDSLWGNQETDSLSHDELLDPKWNRKRTKAEKESSKIKSRAHYGLGKYILRSPGNDLLDFYDSMMLRCDKTSKAWSYIPPSIVYHFRYEHDYPEYIHNKSFNYGRLSYLRDSLKDYYYTKDHTYYGQVYSKRYRWLTDKPHEEWSFDTMQDLKDFARQKLGITLPNNINACSKFTVKNVTTINFHCMCWRGSGAGYTIEFVPDDLNNEYWKDLKILDLEQYNHKTIYNPSELYKIKEALRLNVKPENIKHED